MSYVELLFRYFREQLSVDQSKVGGASGAAHQTVPVDQAWGGDQALSVVQIESVADGKRLAEDERVGVILKSFII